jgi:hypothetical protein
MDGLSSPFDGVASGYSGLGSDAGSDLGATGYGYSTYVAVDYSDALNGDAAYCGDDMDDLETHCLAGGPEMWSSTFGEPPRVATRRGMYSRHAQRPGHRWGWLIKIVGWEKAKKIAKMKKLVESSISVSEAAADLHNQTMKGTHTLTGLKMMDDALTDTLRHLT